MKNAQRIHDAAMSMCEQLLEQERSINICQTAYPRAAYGISRPARMAGMILPTLSVKESDARSSHVS